MTITTSNDSGLGGIIFRANTLDNTYYSFLLARDGSYALSRSDGDGVSGPVQLLERCCLSAIEKGQGQINTIAVVVIGNAITLYVNHHELNHVQDNKYSAGFVGCVATAINKPTDVTYRDVRIWALGNPPLYQLANQ
ncbi:hypothetical protein KDH_11500 [Dictyobacter sp. S3.2.2.5]|uniref:3-keto-disaccharide hydrolase domain-containing protein n=2 Tax=Dictyobacter halimunensis TaxID=3026934 RepID=A0ABQ6FNA2_9CHLR|nr:hypothetical protein KDH_11500 [Dictyobacter sp. S3.2.2.5]